MNPEMSPPSQPEMSPSPPTPEQAPASPTPQEHPSVKPEAQSFSTESDADVMRQARENLEQAYGEPVEAKNRHMPTETMDYYERLGISPEASKEEIRKAYRNSAKSYHPDRNPGDKEAGEAFKLIQEAYDTLSDDSKRLGYNQSFSRVNTSRSERVSHEMPKGTAEALSKLRVAWQKYGRLQPTPEYYQNLEKEFPGYIDSETKVVELLLQLDQSWDTFRSETGLNLSLPESYYDYLVRNHSTLWITWEIEKINLLRELNLLLADKNPDGNAERQNVLRYFLDNWQGPSGSKSSIEAAIRKVRG